MTDSFSITLKNSIGAINYRKKVISMFCIIKTFVVLESCFDFIERIYFMAFRFQSDTKKQLLDLKSVLRYRAWVLIHWGRAKVTSLMIVFWADFLELDKRFSTGNWWTATCFTNALAINARQFSRCFPTIIVKSSVLQEKTSNSKVIT